MRHLFVHRFDRNLGNVRRDTLVAFVASRNVDAGALAAELEAEIDIRLIPDEVILLSRESVGSSIAAAFLSTGTLLRLRQRLSDDTPVTLVTFGEDGHEFRRQALGLADEASDLSLEEALRRGATAIFIAHGGFVESTSAYHFRNPSGRHTSRFMRLSNLLVRQAEITFIGLCALRHVPADTATIYVDTPALFSVVGAINDMRMSEGGLPPIEADSFRSYDGVRTYQRFRPTRAMALISASSSGSLAHELVGRGFQQDQVLHVLFLGDRSPDLVVAIDLRRDAALNPSGYEPARHRPDPADCEMCRDGSIPIPLRGDQFDVAGPQPEPLVIKRTRAHAELSSTMARIAGSGAFRVKLGRRNRQLAIDPALVAAGDDADRRLRYFAAARIPSRLGHCIAPDEHSRPFAERVLAAAGLTMPVLSRDAFEAELAAAAAPFTRPILVASAVVGSGRQLLDVSRSLRRCPDAPLIYFTGLLAAESSERRETLGRSLALTANAAEHPHVVVDAINIPGTGAPNAWDRELALLDETANGGTVLSGTLQARRDRLRQASVALEHDLFLANEADAQLRLRPGFAFWPSKLPGGKHSQADVYYTIAAVLQGLRTERSGSDAQALRTEWFYRTVLSPENFGRFNDGIIQAGLLRAARPSELDFTDNATTSAECARVVRRIVESAATPRGEAAAEFVLALATDRLRLAEGHLRIVLENLPPQTALVDELVAICRERHPDSD